MSAIRNFVLLPLDALRLIGGLVRFRMSGVTPAGSYLAMIRLFCASGGAVNDWLAKLIRVFSRKITLPAPTGSLGITGKHEVSLIVDEIEERGFHVFRNQLPLEICDRLLDFALITPALVRPMKGAANESAQANKQIYDRSSPLAVRYDFEPETVLRCPDVQDLMSDSAILSVAQQYLGVTPKADVLSMWWHTSFSKIPDEEAAQFFHFDMDRIKWLKFFIYLTDVGPDNGPHCFIEGSHRTGGIPKTLLSKGYSRLRDEEVFQHYPVNRMQKFVAPRGTVIAEDTRGLHKGMEVLDGDRLMLQIQFSASLFGGYYPPARLQAPFTPNLSRMAEAHPSIYMNYLSPSLVK